MPIKIKEIKDDFFDLLDDCSV
jgi:Cdc6-like AAA superfamily ATPase